MKRQRIMNRIQELRKATGKSMRKTAAELNIPYTTYVNYEKCEREPNSEMLIILADYFGVSIDYLISRSDDPTPISVPAPVENKLVLPVNVRPVSSVSLPLLGNVACGEPIFAEDNMETFVDAEEGTKADFCLRVKGDSMVNARIFDGDIIFVRKQDMVDDGEIAVVLVEDEATVKRVYYDRENNVLTLMPENPTYKPMRYVGSELDLIRIIGKVIAGQYRIV